MIDKRLKTGHIQFHLYRMVVNPENVFLPFKAIHG